MKYDKSRNNMIKKLCYSTQKNSLSTGTKAKPVQYAVCGEAEDYKRCAWNA